MTLVLRLQSDATDRAQGLAAQRRLVVLAVTTAGVGDPESWSRLGRLCWLREEHSSKSPRASVTFAAVTGVLLVALAVSIPRVLCDGYHDLPSLPARAGQQAHIKKAPGALRQARCFPEGKEAKTEQTPPIIRGTFL